MAPPLEQSDDSYYTIARKLCVDTDHEWLWIDPPEVNVYEDQASAQREATRRNAQPGGRYRTAVPSSDFFVVKVNVVRTVSPVEDSPTTPTDVVTPPPKPTTK